MIDTKIYRDIAARTDGAFMLGVVGPVRTGKSTFIKRFMETMVIPEIENTYTRERARDELPQSGSGRTIMTAEPKFIPEEAVRLSLDGCELSVRLVDCVGYMVEGAAGQFENGVERLVATPWFEQEVSMTTAAEEGTRRVIAEHSTIGIVVTTDGSICGIEREKYLEPEQRVIEELQRINKPFVVLMNSAEPESDAAISAAAELEQKFGVSCLRVNCQTLDENDMCRIMRCVLEEFPVKSIGFYPPDWLDALGGDNKMKSALYDAIKMHCDGIRSIKDTHSAIKSIEELEFISSADVKSMELGNGDVTAVLTLPRGIFYQIVSDEAGVEINNDGELIKMLTVMAAVKTDYDSLRSALDAVRSGGYGVVMPLSGQVQLDEPQIVRQGGKYTVKLKARSGDTHADDRCRDRGQPCHRRGIRVGGYYQLPAPGLRWRREPDMAVEHLRKVAGYDRGRGAYGKNRSAAGQRESQAAADSPAHNQRGQRGTDMYTSLRREDAILTWHTVNYIISEVTQCLRL